MNTTAGGRSAGSVPVRTTAREAHGEAASRTFGLPVVVDLLENLHRVRAPAAHFRVPEEEPLGLDVPVDETADRRAERLLLVGAWCFAHAKATGIIWIRNRGAAAAKGRTSESQSQPRILRNEGRGDAPIQIRYLDGYMESHRGTHAVEDGC